MTDQATRVLELALRLSAKERAKVVAELLDSLPEDHLHPDWDRELELRAGRAHREADGGEPWPEAERRLLSRLDR